MRNYCLCKIFRKLLFAVFWLKQSLVKQWKNLFFKGKQLRSSSACWKSIVGRWNRPWNSVTSRNSRNAWKSLEPLAHDMWMRTLWLNPSLASQRWSQFQRQPSLHSKVDNLVLTFYAATPKSITYVLPEMYQLDTCLVLPIIFKQHIALLWAIICANSYIDTINQSVKYL